MTTDRDFDLIAQDWLADGPNVLSDRVLDSVVDQIHLTRQRRALRVPWRLPTMTTPARVAAAAAIGVLVLGGSLIFLGGGAPSAPAPTPAPSLSIAPTPSASIAGVPPFTAEFTSPRHGFSLRYPAAWAVAPATKSWAPGTELLYGDPAFDAIGTATVRLAAASQPLRDGQTPDQWLVANCRALGRIADECGPRISIGNITGFVDEDGSAASGGTVAQGGVIYDAAAVIGRRGYTFTLDGLVDRRLFEALLATVTFDPRSAVDLPPLTSTFTSPTYGYSIKVDPSWTATPASKQWHDDGNSSDFMDGIEITGTDTNLGMMSQALGTRTFAEFVSAFYTNQLDAIGPGCVGGDPSVWPEIPIGDQTGKLEVQCGSSEALVQAGDRVYLFELGASGFDIQNPKVSVAALKVLLASVTFAPIAIDLPPLTATFTSPRHGYSIGTAAGWTATQDADGIDQIAIVGTDTTISAWSQVLPTGTTFAAWLLEQRQEAIDGKPQGCDGGDPATWPTVPVGAESGRLQMFCNAAMVHVEVGGRVYGIEWGNSTFDVDSHLPLAAWKELLRSVTFDPGSARD